MIRYNGLSADEFCVERAIGLVRSWEMLAFYEKLCTACYSSAEWYCGKLSTTNPQGLLIRSQVDQYDEHLPVRLVI